ncbi:MAG TPA: aldo/keto reductase [Candidatus Hydrogenedentes bacterium]|mgnify:FL=1|nr:aldo/keto reductase [Candidatus Hydrogenedentota bacterium]
MIYRKLGKWGVRISALGMGTDMNLGDRCDEAMSREMVRLAYEAGVNYFDTANGYGNGNAETMLGKCLADYPRNELFVLTKVGGHWREGPNASGLSAKHIRESCDESLRKLGMDYVDVLMCHRPDPNTPLEETVRAMDDLIRSGKVLYWGVSNWPAGLLAKTNAVARALGAREVAANEPRYNLVYRFPETLIFPTTRVEGIGNVTFSPLGHGLLAGIYKPGQAPPSGSRAAVDGQNPVTRGLYFREDRIQKAQEFTGIADELGVQAAELAIAWVMRQPDVTSCILGAWRPEELALDLKAAALSIPDDVLAKLDKLFPPPLIPTV